jgi:predicted DNA-binding transcriptional regulator AlpA
MSASLGTKVFQYSINNELIQKYDSINEALRLTGISKSTIGKVIRENTYLARNFIWKKQ